MCALLFKELRYIFCSFAGLLFSIVFLLICGSLLWIVPGNYNIADSGYASLSPFFSLAPTLLLILIPALSMRTFSEEKRQGTLSLLLTRPVRFSDIVFSKYLSIFIAVIILLIPTIVYTLSLYWHAIPQGNIDLGAIAGSYLGLVFLVAAFTSISVFSSSLTTSQVVAFISGLLICVFFYFGFDLISTLFSSGKIQFITKSIGFLSHYQSVQKGVIDTNDVGYMIIISCLFLLFTIQTLHLDKKLLTTGLSILLLFFIINSFIKYRFDLTADKRYTISQPLKKALKDIKTPVIVTCYLSGDLNAGFFQLQKACTDMLEDFSSLSSGNISYQIVNPYLQSDNKQFIRELAETGIKGIPVNERNKEGKMTQQIVFPWLLIQTEEREIPVNLLINESGRSGSENLNMSIEMLEYQIGRALKSVSQENARKIAFLQGHGELSQDQMADLFDALSYYYQVDLGVLSGISDPATLNEYELIIVPGPQDPFSEKDKYLLDQYIMHGGKVLWVINGVKLDLQYLATTGFSPSMVNDVNLDDLFFDYGFRVNPVLLEDMQCLEIPLNTNTEETDKSFTSAPWYFAPVLNAPSGSVITKGVSLVKSEFTSTISFVGKNAEDATRNHILLHSSEFSAIVNVPEMISLHEVNRTPDKNFFNKQYLPVAALIEGNFISGFRNRTIPEGIKESAQPFKKGTDHNKMIVIASENIICNEITGSGSETEIWPLGYDRFMDIQFGNKDFVLNAIDYLADESDFAVLRTKHFQLNLLDSKLISQNNLFFIFINVIIPPTILLIVFVVNFVLRKRKYNKA